MRIEALEALASEMVGDGQEPNWFFVTLQGDVVGVTQDFESAYSQWDRLSRQSPRVECALEDRLTGVLASVEPIDDGSTTLVRLVPAAMWAQWRG